MNEITFRAMATDWYVAAAGVATDVLAEAERIVRDEERRFSRFRDDSALTALNERRVLREPVVAGVMRTALRFRRHTRGAFDPAIGAALIAAGYDRDFAEVARDGAPAGCADPRRPAIDVRGDTVRLHGSGAVDLGGIVKGWTVDRVAAQLRGSGATAVVVDGGGDIRVWGEAPGAAGWCTRGWAIEAGDRLTVVLRDGAVATSSVCRRRWSTPQGEAHHIIAPERGAPAATAATTATVVAEDATTADVLATALLADLERGLDAVARSDAAALVASPAGWRMTPSMDRYLA